MSPTSVLGKMARVATSNRQFVACTYLFLIAECALVVLNVQGKVDVAWQWLVVYGWFFTATTAFTVDPAVFFGAKSSSGKENESLDWRKLAVSTYITWVFAKSIFNAATLGGKFGLIGGIAYACWYLAFPVVGFTVYRIRSKTSYKHLTELIINKYGVGSVIVFSLIIIYRLFMEIWSNAVVVADLFGEQESAVWWSAVYTASCMPAIYIIMGGFRTSIFSDIIQGVVVLLFLLGIWAYLLAESPDAAAMWKVNGMKLDDGWDIVIVGVIQGGISYGFMDPVLSDRAFLSTKDGMLKAFILGGFLAGGVIFLFSFVGIYGNQVYGNGGNPIETARSMGSTVFQVLSLIFITSSVSTLDSTYSSLAKLVALEIDGYAKKGKAHGVAKDASTQGQIAGRRILLLGRVTIFFFAAVGPLILLSEKSALSATTISGTVVMGIGFPIIFFDRVKGRKPLAFLLPTVCGLVIGIMYQTKNYDFEPFLVGNGSYNKLLGVNLYGTAACAVAFVIGALLPYPQGKASETVKPKKAAALAAVDVDVDDDGAQVPALTEEDGGADLQDVKIVPSFLKGVRCPKGHAMLSTCTTKGDYVNGFTCDHCGSAFSPGTERWNCAQCQNNGGYDACHKCLKRSSTRNVLVIS